MNTCIGLGITTIMFMGAFLYIGWKAGYWRQENEELKMKLQNLENRHEMLLDHYETKLTKVKDIEQEIQSQFDTDAYEQFRDK